MESNFRKISIIGLGYIGLPTAAMFAGNGLEVVGVDVNKNIVDKVNKGEVHIIEPDLEEKVADAVRNKKLRASMSVEESDAFIIAVPTPFKENHKPDISFVEAAAQSIAPALRAGNLVILESTSPVGTTLRIVRVMAEMRPDLKFPAEGNVEADVHVAYCPERVLPGKTMHELVHNDRVIGGIQKCCSERAKTLYELFVKGECLLTDSKTAEMTKLTENSYRDVNIAFANELSIICDKLGIDVWELIRLANHHPRVKILSPGPGVGGHCIAVDPWFIVDSTPEEAKLIKTAREVNDLKPEWVISKIEEAIRKVGKPLGDGSKPKVACLGLSFKANIDDLRESPALEIVHHLAKMDCCDVLVVEPNIGEVPPILRPFQHLSLVSLQEAVRKADLVVGLVDHDEFKKLNVTDFRGKAILDTRGIWGIRRFEPFPRKQHIVTND
ncbi:MAG: UDP-N-acetyl-D-mannosamine dehydrogenase [Bacteroidetes bacterium]|nr:UDP-N-acetyl-D-mannosamine dehydrogenase [Bacteroidota bacterium]